MNGTESEKTPTSNDMPATNGGNLHDTTDYCTEFGALITPEMVDAYVGQEHKLFRVHKKLLCHRAPFFNALFDDNWKEGKEGSAFLDDDDPAVFEVFLNWLYRGSIENISKLDVLSSSAPHRRAIDVYIFADKLQINLLKNSILDCIQQGLLAENRVLCFQDMTKVYEFTLGGSPLRRFAAKLSAWHLQTFPGAMISSYLDDNSDPELARDLITLLRGRAVLHDPREPSKCEFHEHKDGEICHIYK